MVKTIRAEIRGVVDEADRAGKPITAQVIWGLLSTDVPEDSFTNILSSMCGSHQLAKVPAPDGVGRKGAHCYEPGAVAVPENTRPESHPRLMGNMEHVRLENARAAAREWLQDAPPGIAYG